MTEIATAPVASICLLTTGIGTEIEIAKTEIIKKVENHLLIRHIILRLLLPPIHPHVPHPILTPD